MSLKLILIFTYILNIIKGIEEFSEKNSYLNDFITITENFSFTIRTIYNSIAYFDSFDKNCLIYTNNERIDGKFYEINPNKDYIISLKLLIQTQHLFYEGIYLIIQLILILKINQLIICILNNKLIIQ